MIGKIFSTMIDAKLLLMEDDNASKTHLISIAVSEYVNFMPLPGAIKDAKAIINALRPKYKIDSCTEIHEDEFTEQRIKEVFEGLSPNSKDSLIVIYNGHGVLDHNNHFYLAPKRSEKDIYTTWYLATNIYSEIKKIDIAHVAVIVNCCYSGMMHSQQIDPNKAFNNNEKISRWLLTGGKREQSVEDTSENSENSPFVEEIVKYLKENNDEYKISLAGLYSRVNIKLEERENYEEPTLSYFGSHQGSNFYLYLSEGDEAYWKKIEDKDTIEGYYSYMAQFSTGKHFIDAHKRINELKNERKEWLEAIKQVKTTLFEFTKKSESINGHFQKDAEDFLTTFDKTTQNLSKEKEREEDWTTISNNDNLEDFEDFETKWKEGKYIIESQAKRRRLKKELRADNDWKKAIQSTDPKIKRGLFRSFITDYPYDSRASQAKIKEEDIKNFLNASEDTNPNKKIKKLREYKGAYESKAKEMAYILESQIDHKRFEERLQIAINADDLDILESIKEEIEGRTDKERQSLLPVYERTISMVNKLNKQIENSYNKAIESSDLLDVVEFIEKYERGNFVSKAIEYFQNEEQRYYDELVTEDSIESCEKYLSNFKRFEKIKLPVLIYIGEVEKWLSELSKDKNAFFQAKTLESLKKYILDVELGIYVGKCIFEAKQRVKQIEKEEQKSQLYQKILESPTIELCQQFVLDFLDAEDERYKKVDKTLVHLLMSKSREESYQAILIEENLEKRLTLSQAFLNIYGNEEDRKYVEEVKGIRKECILEQEDSDVIEKAKNIDSINGRKEALTAYLKKDSPRRKIEAENLLLEINQDIQKDDEAFENAKNAETIEKKIEELNIYLQRDNPRNREEAEKCIRNLELEKQDIELFERTKMNDNTISGWAIYIAKSQDEERKNWGITQRKKLMKEKEEDDYFEIIKAQKSKEECLRYLEIYRNNGGRYVKDVEFFLMELLSSTYMNPKELVNETIQLFSDKQKKWGLFIFIFFISVLLLMTILLSILAYFFIFN